MPKVPLAKRHDVVEAIPPDRSDEQFLLAVLLLIAATRQRIN
jgi:hypothetical protein